MPRHERLRGATRIIRVYCALRCCYHTFIWRAAQRERRRAICHMDARRHAMAFTIRRAMLAAERVTRLMLSLRAVAMRRCSQLVFARYADALLFSMLHA